MSEFEAAEPYAEEAAAPTAMPHPAPSAGAVILGDRNDLHIGDYVGFERISPSKDWKLSLGKVIAFPSTRTVKVAHYDSINPASVALDPISEKALHQQAEANGQMDLWHNREALREDLMQATAKEAAATQRLFNAREETANNQISAGEKVTEALERLDAARRELRAIPSKQWHDLRNSAMPPAEVMGVMRSVMLVLYEDKVSAWEDIQEVMSRPDFMERIVGWDCTVTPMSLPRRQKIVALCAGEMEASLKAAKKRHRSDAHSSSAAAAPLTIAAKSDETGNFATLDKRVRQWLNAQIFCSEAAREQEIVMNDCFAGQQEQRILLREINDMRVGISSIQVQMLEMKNAILGIEDGPKPIMPLEAYPTDTVFYKRTYPDSEGRFVQEIILRDAVVINFGPMADEDTEGYVRLTPSQVDYLRNAAIASNVRHDAEEMEELLARKEREEQEIAELKARIQELRSKSSLTAEEEEELAQLEKLLANAKRGHRVTLSRIADLYACGRGAREITLAIKRPEFRYTRLHCKMSGDWAMILDDPEQCNEMLAAFCADISTMLNLPAGYVLDVDARAGSLLIDFTVKHNGDLDDEELQNMINKGEFSALCMFYEKVTLKKTSPLNTQEQQEAYDREQRYASGAISGMGMKQRLADYYNADGTLDEEFDEATKAHPDYRKAVITITPLREDYDEAVVRGPYEQYAGEDAEAPDAAVATSALASTAEARKAAELMAATQNSMGLTRTTGAANETTEAVTSAEAHTHGAEDGQQAEASAPAADGETADAAALAQDATGSHKSSRRSTPLENAPEL